LGRVVRRVVFLGGVELFIRHRHTSSRELLGFNDGSVSDEDGGSGQSDQQLELHFCISSMKDSIEKI
jgi:hypothetical protein